MPTLIDEVSWQLELDALDNNKNSPLYNDEQGEDTLMPALNAAIAFEPSLFLSKKTLLAFSLPRSFAQACQDLQWAKEIEREYNALAKSKSWILIPRESSMKPVPFTWVFWIKNKLDGLLYRPRCCVRGDLQKTWIDFNRDNT